MQVIEALRTSPLLAALGEKQLAGLATVARERTFAAGQTMIEEGKERARAMFVILEGTAEVRTGDRVLATLAAGDHVGEMALVLADQTRTADVVTTSDVRAVQLSRWDFVPYLKTNPEVAMAVIEELARRLDESNRRTSG